MYVSFSLFILLPMYILMHVYNVYVSLLLVSSYFESLSRLLTIL